MPETLTRSESQKIVDDVQKEIGRISNAIKEKKVGDYSMEVLEKKKTMLQNQLDKLLKQGGIITEDDYNESYNIIRAKEEKELLDLKKKSNRTMIMWGGLVLAIIVAYFIVKKK